MKRYRSPTERRRNWYLPVLTAITILALLLPDRWTGPLISAVQVTVPLQDAAGAVWRKEPAAAASSGRDRGTEALRHQAAALAARVAELEREVEILTATRLRDIGGKRLGSRGKLIPARVVAEDLLPWRSSRLLDAGSLQGVRRGAPVASRYFTLDQGSERGVRDGMAVLLGEVLVGWVEQVGTHTARMKLLSDVDVQMKVRLGRFTENGFALLERGFWLVGRGHGVMQILDAERRDVEAGRIAVGDVVLTDPSGDVLPASMTVGTVAAIETDPKHPLLSILTVRSPVDPNALRRVYIYEPD
ncbi:MAG: rod shape-determining protein MreC [Planctomycetota bacterium]|nr:MAG: rod shape-determining protein MreC [Planctomycetota bacterium]